MDTITELIAVCEDMRSESASKKRRRYLESEAPEEDDDGRVVQFQETEDSEWPDSLSIR